MTNIKVTPEEVKENMQDVIDCIEPTVEVKKIIKPIYNFKAKSREQH